MRVKENAFLRSWLKSVTGEPAALC